MGPGAININIDDVCFETPNITVHSANKARNRTFACCRPAYKTVGTVGLTLAMNDGILEGDSDGWSEGAAVGKSLGAADGI